MISIEISVPIGRGHSLKGNLDIPSMPNSVVIFSDCKGRANQDNRYLVNMLNNHGIATFFPDLLTREEVNGYDNQYNIDLLSERLFAVTNYAVHLRNLYNLPAGFIGSGTGAATAIRVAAWSPSLVRAMVLNGARIDLAGNSLKIVKQPTLLIADEGDAELVKLNQYPFIQLTCEKEFRIIENSKRLNKTGELAVQWFAKYLSLPSQQAA